MEAVALLALECNAYIFQYREVRKYRRNLKGAHHPGTGDGRRPHGSNVATVEQYLPRGRDQKLGQQVENSGLTCPVGADKRMYVSAGHLEVDIIHRGETLELLYQISGFKNVVCTHV